MKQYHGSGGVVMDVERSRFPYCVVWTPIPVLTWFFPIIGHMGICTSAGVIRDFAGPYFVSEDNMAFGKPAKFWKLDPGQVYASGPNAWDTAVHDASEEYKHRMHNLCCDNCHSHVALALNLMRYNNSTNWNMVTLCCFCLIYGKYVSKLRASLEDPWQLKILTGDWFQEARSQRHHHAHFGSDLVRASIRRKKSPKGDQALGSDGEAEAAGENTIEGEPESRVSIEVAAPERNTETQGPDLFSPYVPSKASEGQEEEPQDQECELEAPGEGGVQVAEADPELDPEQKAEQESQPTPAQSKATSKILENGEEAPGLGPSLDRMLSSSSSVSSLNSSTLSGSLMSLSGEAEAGTVQVRGSVLFSLRYEPGTSELRVQVIQCQGLAAARRRRSDPYVKSYLLPDKQSKRKTSVKKRNLNPIFNETLRHSVQQADLPGRVLSLSVWHRESLGRNIFLGEVEVPLDTWNWDSEATWLPLQPRVPPSPDELPSRGLLSLSLKYVPAGSEGGGQPQSGELHFWVKEAQSLVPLRPGSLDTYIQCSVLPDDSRASRQRTRVVRRSLSPVFNHTMVYDGFGPADLRQACAELSLWDHGALASRQLGGTRLSLGTGSSYGLQVPWMDSTPEEKQLWQTLLERPCEWVDGLLPLRTNLVPRA